MPKVLYIAFACEPDKGSEPEVGWNFSRLLADRCQVWILTEPAHRAGIEAYMRQNPQCNLQVVYHNLPKWQKPLLRLGGYNLHYLLWQQQVWRTARKLHAREQFDLVHHVTYARYWMPSASRKLDVPYVWGPLGGAEGVPWKLLRQLDWPTGLREAARSCVRRLFEWLPSTRHSIRRASLILAGTQQTARRLRELGAKHVEVVAMIGCLAEAVQSKATTGDGLIRFVSAGRILHWKGFDLGLRAFAKAALQNARYVIIGAGPQRRRLAQLAASLGIEHQVEFTGKVGRDECIRRMGHADVLVHPSLHDSGAYVCLEALCLGKPVICLDVGGPALQIDDACGYKIKPRDLKQVIGDLASAMRRLDADENLRRSMGLSARQRALEMFTWNQKAAAIEDLYHQVLSRTRNDPCVDRPMTGKLTAKWAT